MKSLFNRCIVVLLALCISLAANADYTVTAIPNNSSMGSVSGSGTYIYHQTCTLTANPAQNYHFVCWSNGSTSRTLSFRVNSDTLFVATFAVNEYNLTALSNNTDLGTVSGSGRYTSGWITVTASPLAHCEFKQWSNGSTSQSISVNLTKDTVITATFAKVKHTVTVASNDTNKGTVNGEGNFDYGTNVTVTATPKQHYFFKQWSNGITTPFYSFDLNNNVNLTATFETEKHMLTVRSNNTSLGTVSASSGTYNHGSTVRNITATPANSHCRFTGWSNGSKTPTIQIQLTKDSTVTANFAIDNHTVNVNANVPNSGTVSVSGTGPYTHGSVVTVYATPAQHKVFQGWSNGMMLRTFSFIVDRDTTLIANFAPESHNLTVQSNNTSLGSVFGSGIYDYNTSHTITATPKAHCHFVKWSNGITSSNTSITLTKDSVLTAIFALDQHTVTVATNDANKGTVTGNNTYEYGAVATVTAIPNPHFVFQSWSNGVTTPNYSFAVNQNISLTATFVPERHTVTAMANNAALGSVTGSGNYDHNAVCYLNPTPNDNCHFVSWSNGVETNAQIFNVTSDSVIVANFALNQHQLSVNSSDNKLGTVSSVSGQYNYGSVIDITATPLYSYCRFTGWSNGVTSPTAQIRLTKDSTITAIFALNNHSVVVNANTTAGGSVTGSGNFTHGQTVTVTATPKAGYVFQGWSNGIATPSLTFVLDRDTILTANFAHRQVSVIGRANDVAMGSVTGSCITNINSSITLTAIPAVNCHFVAWSNGRTENPLTFIATKDTVVVATFALNQHIVNLQANDPVKGYVNGGGYFYHDSTAIVTATANPNYIFDHWSTGSTDSVLSFVVTNDTNITAYFVNAPYIVSAEANDTNMGLVTGVGTYNYLDICTLIATPKQNYHFVDWSNGSTVNPLQLTVNSNITIVANFAIDRHNLTVVSDNETFGSVSGSGIYDYGTPVQITATPANSHCVFAGWSNGETLPTITINLTKDSVITAYFALDSHTVSLSVNDTSRGYIVSGIGEYSHGDTVTVTAAARPHCTFLNWSNGVTSPSFSFVIDRDTTLTAFFQGEYFNVTAVANNPTMGNVTGSGLLEYNTQATLVAIPAPNHHFMGWNNGSTDSILNFTVTSDTLFIATFGVDYKHNLTVLSNDNDLGTVSGSGTYDHGTQVEITAILVNPQAVFLRWSNGTTTPVTTIDLTKDSTLTAIFVLNEYNISVSVNDENIGSVTGGGSYSYGDVAELTAIPTACSHFVCWSDSVTENPRIFIVDDSLTLTAYFDVNYYSIALAVSDTAAGKAWFDITDLLADSVVCGTEVVVKAKPSLYYRFVEWSDGLRDTLRTVNVTSDTLIIAIFEPSCGNYADFPVKFRYNSLLMIDLDSIVSRGYNPAPEQVEWYQVVDDVDSLDVTFPADDRYVCNGYYLSLTGTNAGYGKYYAVVDVSNSEGALCHDRMRTVVVDYTAAANHTIVQIAPTTVRNDEIVKLTGLNPSETTSIAIFDAAGKMVGHISTESVSDYSLRANGIPGVYMIRVNSESVNETLRFIISR